MSNRKKSMLMMFVDYLISFVIQILFLLLFDRLLKTTLSFFIYSMLLSLLLFGLIYSRAHKAAERDRRLPDVQRGPLEGLLLATPLTVFNGILILVFALMQQNIIPIRDVVLTTIYSFPENEPRIATDIYLFDYINIGIRLWFGTVEGFMGQTTSVIILCISPLLTLSAGFVGYLAGRKNFYILNALMGVKEKIQKKFNE